MANAVNLVFLNVETSTASTKRNKTGNIRTYKLTLWGVRVTVLQMETQRSSLRVLLNYMVTANYIKILSVAQQCFLC